MKQILKPTILAVLLAAALASCARSEQAGPLIRSIASLTVNGPGVDGSLHTQFPVIYTLSGITQDLNYTLRTSIALQSEDVTENGEVDPDGALEMKIYASLDAYKNNEPELGTAVAAQQSHAHVYELNFTAGASGDFVVVISGESESVPGLQFFYDLRFMSADASLLTPFATTTIPASDTQSLDPGYLKIYGGGTISSGTYTVSIVSESTTTLDYPQLFVYLDSSLTINSLLLSSIPTETNFRITYFDDREPVDQDTDVVSSLTFTADEGPFLVLKGMTSTATYSLSVE